jgi:hypothetical protein
MTPASHIIPTMYKMVPNDIPIIRLIKSTITDCAMKKSKMESIRVPIAFMSPISRRLVTISRDSVVEITTAPRIKTRSRIDQTKVEKNIPIDTDKDLASEYVDTSRRTLPKRKMKVVDVTAQLRDNRVSTLLKGRRFRSLDANP